MGTNSRLSRIYDNMKKRCYSTTNPSYKDYGGRGITICSEWLNSEKVHNKNATKGWIAFQYWAMTNGYNSTLTLDRIDNSKGYSPSNCRWVSMETQCNNKRSNHCITYNGQTKTLAEWCKTLNLSYDRTKQRINKLKWSTQKAFETH